MLKDTVTIGVEEYGCTSSTYFKHDNCIYLKEGSNDFYDLRKTIETIIPKLTKMSEKEADILTKSLVQFFIRNDGFDSIINNRTFWFNEYPIAILKKGDLNNLLEDHLEVGYISYKSDYDKHEKILKGVIEFGFEYYEYDLDYDFNIYIVARELRNLLIENETLSNYLFGFYIEGLSNDKILVGSNIIDISGFDKLIPELGLDNLNGLYSVKNRDSISAFEGIKPTYKISYEQNLSKQYTSHVLLHEVLHAIFDAYDIDVLKIAEKHNNNKNNIEEELVHQLSFFLSTVIMDNKELVINTLDANDNLTTFDEIERQHNNHLSKRETIQIKKQKHEKEFNELVERTLREREESKIASEKRIAGWYAEAGIEM
ncbi:MAG: hypothetical protein RR440_00405 [Erysipelotrichaceae bacterium]